MELDRFAHPVGDDGISGRIAHQSRAPVRTPHRIDHLLAQLFARVDHSAGFAERRVAAGVIDMDMRVDENADGLRADALDRRHHFVRDLSVLRVDDEHSVGTVEHADPAAGAVRVSWIDILVAGEHREVGRE